MDTERCPHCRVLFRHRVDDTGKDAMDAQLWIGRTQETLNAEAGQLALTTPTPLHYDARISQLRQATWELTALDSALHGDTKYAAFCRSV